MLALAALAVLALANPAAAASLIPIRDPSNLALLALGVAGLVIGHRSARKRHRDE